MAFLQIAEVYELLSPAGPRLAKEGAFLAQWAAGGLRLLELACGPGAHAHALAVEGVPGRTVLATDLSPAMVQRARERYQAPGLSFSQADLLAPPAGPYDRVYILGNSLNLLADGAAVRNAFAALRKAAEPGASLLLQILNPRAPSADGPKQVVKTFTQGGVDIVVIKSLVPHAGRRTLTLSSFQKNQEGGWRHFSETEILLDLDRPALEALMKDSGWIPTAWHGGMDASPLSAESIDLVVTAKPA